MLDSSNQHEAARGAEGVSHTLPETSPGTVVLLHGLGANSWLMLLLAYRLKLQGYQVENWGYYSVWQSLGTLVPEFTQRFQALQQSLPAGSPLHVVCHSMGSIITRAVLQQVELPSLHRIVMLSPPNKGSHVASWVGPYLRWLTPLVDELSDRVDSYVNRLPLPRQRQLEIGIIAAEWDYVLSELSTHLDCEVDHITLPSRHTGLVLRRAAAVQVLHFLRYGRFHREPCPFCLADSTSLAEMTAANLPHSATAAN
jgi:pimeloyl-ACP methyl ester carboxylesterase